MWLSFLRECNLFQEITLQFWTKKTPLIKWRNQPSLYHQNPLKIVDTNTRQICLTSILASWRLECWSHTNSTSSLMKIQGHKTMKSTTSLSIGNFESDFMYNISLEKRWAWNLDPPYEKKIGLKLGKTNHWNISFNLASKSRNGYITSASLEHALLGTIK